MKVRKPQKRKTMATPVVLPEEFKVILPDTLATDALKYFDIYLEKYVRVRNSKKQLTKLKPASIKTYKNCAQCFILKYGVGKKLKHLLHYQYLLDAVKDDSMKGQTALSMVRCGLTHFKRMYEICCKQNVEEGVDIYERKKFKRTVSHKINYTNCRTISNINNKEMTHTFVESNKIIPTTREELVNYLNKFQNYQESMVKAIVFDQCGINASTMIRNAHENIDEEEGF